QVLMAAAVEAGADGLGARRAAVVLGWDSASASRVEGARARLKSWRALQRARCSTRRIGRAVQAVHVLLTCDYTG
ncbi:hypothetical protein ACLIYN_14115, partial [Streptomyces atacamensis]